MPSCPSLRLWLLVLDTGEKLDCGVVTDVGRRLRGGVLGASFEAEGLSLTVPLLAVPLAALLFSPVGRRRGDRVFDTGFSGGFDVDSGLSDGLTGGFSAAF
jgi:hypothetical protein